MRRANAKRRRGFSLVELVVVVAIMLAIAAYATPNIMSAVSDYRLKGSMTSVAGLYQQQRMQAVRLNSVYTSPTPTTVNGATTVWFEGPGGNGTYDAGEPMIQLPQNISVVTSGAPTFDPNAMGLGYTPVSQSTYKVRFNQRGLPCVTTSSTSAIPCLNLDTTSTPGTATPIGFLIYFKNNKSFGETGYGAITITPAGRIRTWFYTGSTYAGM